MLIVAPEVICVTLPFTFSVHCTSQPVDGSTHGILSTSPFLHFMHSDHRLA